LDLTAGQAHSVAGYQGAHSAAPPEELRRKRNDSALEWSECCLALALYLWLVFRILSSYLIHGGLADLLLLPAEGVVIGFLLIRRRATEMSRALGEWLVALVATCAPLLVSPKPGHTLVPIKLAAAVLLAGILIELLAKITLGRSIGCVPAHRGLKLSGPYRFVRHPMYTGYFLSQLAFLAVNPSLGNTALYALGWGLQLYRIRAEERLLSHDPQYRHYQSVVRYRLVPGLF
jgi:protein-S-isoprenylcysteine O-methyltransferase Ste14